MSFDVLQWPGMLVAVVGAWFVGGAEPARRAAGFTCFLISNALLIAWAAAGGHWAILTMQVLFTVTSLRGLRTNVGLLRGKQDVPVVSLRSAAESAIAGSEAARPSSSPDLPVAEAALARR